MTYKTIHSQQRPDGTWLQPLADGLGTIRAEVDETLEIDATSHYTPYGNPFGQTGTSATPFAFTGEERDANGLQYHRARYYAPEKGIWPSLDPLEGEVEEVMSLNRYGYVGGNVMNVTDPSGNSPNCHDYSPPDCPKDSYPSFGGAEGTTWKCCSNYERQKSVNYALNYRIYPNSAFCDHDNNTCGYTSEVSDCANFVSQALDAGNHPQSWPTANPPTAGELRTSTDREEYWATSYHATHPNGCSANCDSTKLWSVAKYLGEDYLGGKLNVNPTVFYGRGLPEDGLGRIDDVFLALHNSGIRAGDVLYIPDSNPPHVALVVGWGPKITRWEDVASGQTLTEVHSISNDVPYVVDHGGQGGWGMSDPRPYYMLRWFYKGLAGASIGGSSSWISHFYAVPDRTCVEPQEAIRDELNP